jgi:hypothetical protein
VKAMARRKKQARMTSRLEKRRIYCKFEESCKSIEEIDLTKTFREIRNDTGSITGKLLVNIQPVIKEKDKMSKNCHNLGCVYYVKILLPKQQSMNKDQIKEYNKKYRKV